VGCGGAAFQDPGGAVGALTAVAPAAPVSVAVGGAAGAAIGAPQDAQKLAPGDVCAPHWPQ
jgi:hypothetical protein